jgi:sugar lactone lactonase YvrE
VEDADAIIVMSPPFFFSLLLHSTLLKALECPPGVYLVGSSCATCPAGSSCPGDGRAVPCNPPAACASAGLAAQPFGVCTTTLLAGSGISGAGNGVGSAASFTNPIGISSDGGSLYVADQYGQTIRRVALASRVVTTIAGSGSCRFGDGLGASASFCNPTSVVWCPAAAAAYVCDTTNFRVRKLAAAGAVTTFAGSGSSAGKVDGPALSASFSYPWGIAVDSAGLVYLADTGNAAIRLINPSTNVVSTLAGGTQGFADGLGAAAKFNLPSALYVAAGRVFVADMDNKRVRAVDLSNGMVTTLAGSAGITPVNGFGTTASFGGFFGITGDEVFAYVGDSNTIRRINTTDGNVQTVFGGGLTYSEGNCIGALVPSNGLALLSDGTLFAADSSNRAIYRYSFASVSPTPTSTKTPSQTATVSPTLTPTVSGTVTPSSTSTLSSSGTPTNSGTGTLTPTPSQTATSTPSQSPTPSTSPPPFSCLSSPTGCLAPLLLVSPPIGVFGFPLPFHSAPQATALVSWPAVSTPFSVRLPLRPSHGESASVTCTSDGNGAVGVIAAPAQPTCAPPSASCVAVPSSNGEGPCYLNFSVGATTNTTLSSTITCALTSTPLAQSSSAGLPFPRFGLRTVTAPLLARAMRFSLPLLSAVLRESSVAMGEFTVAGGGERGATLSLPTADALFQLCPGSLASYVKNLTFTPSFWATGDLVLSCPLALRAITAAADALRASPAAPSLSAALSGSRHLLLVASILTPFPPFFEISIALGGVPCTVNWATPALVSVTSPPLSMFSCSASSADCGLAPLMVTFNSTDYLPLSAAYPPLLPSADWSAQLAVALDPAVKTTPLASAAALAGLAPPLVLASSLALSPPNTGIRIVARCADASFAPPEVCVVVNYTQPLHSPGAGLCVWGTGEVCLPCPEGALCPGGAVLLPLPGFWCPTASSPPTEVYACPQPDAALRCPGYAAVTSVGGGYGCGTGFRGQVCAACDVGYFPTRGTCAPCPLFSAVAVVQPILIFGGFLCAGGVCLLLMVWCTLRYAGKKASMLDAALPVGSLLVWVWIAAQGLSSLFFQAQALAPPALAVFYAAAAALQFQGIALDPTCYASIPFLNFYVAVGVVLSCYALAAGAFCCLQRLQAPRARSAAAMLLSLTAFVLSIGYGALTAEFSSALVCTVSAPLTVADYVLMDNDGAALLAHFPTLTRSNLQSIRAASTNPFAAAALGLVTTLQATFPVSVLASDPYKVCNEAAHRVVRPLAGLMCAAFTLGLPFLQLAGLWAVGRLKGLRRRTNLEKWCFSGGGTAAVAATSQSLIEAFNAALGDAALQRHSAWFSAFQKLQLALITGLIASSRARLPSALYIASQSAIICVCALSSCIVARVRLFTPADAWKWPVVFLLGAVTATTALMNAVLLVLDERALGPADRTALAGVPLAFAALTTATLFVSWLRSLRQYTLAAVLTPPPVPLPPPVPAVCANPLVSASEGVVVSTRIKRRRRKKTRLPNPVYTLMQAADGDTYWLDKSANEASWVLPRGADTSDGWLYVRAPGVRGFWQHVGTGEIATGRTLICRRTVAERIAPGAEAPANNAPGVEDASPAAGELGTPLQGAVVDRVVFLPRAVPLGAPDEFSIEAAPASAPGVEGALSAAGERGTPLQGAGVDRVAFLPRAVPLGAPDDFSSEAWYRPSMSASAFIDEMLRARVQQREGALQ